MIRDQPAQFVYALATVLVASEDNLLEIGPGLKTTFDNLEAMRANSSCPTPDLLIVYQDFGWTERYG